MAYLKIAASIINIIANDGNIKQKNAASIGGALNCFVALKYPNKAIAIIKTIPMACII
jgi:hypothetical protein